MKNHCGELVGFSFRAALWFRQPVCLCKVFWDLSYIRPSCYFTDKCNDSVRFPFLFSLFFVKDQIASFQLEKTQIPIKKKSGAILYHVDISRQYFSVYQLKIMFYFLHELKQRSSDVTGHH